MYRFPEVFCCADGTMLECVHIENYKCLRDVTVKLGKFTVLIGPNDSGKSSFLDAIRTLARLTQEPLTELFHGDRTIENLIWQGDTERSLIWEISGTFTGDPFTYHVEIPSSNKARPEWLKWNSHDLFCSNSFPRGGAVQLPVPRNKTILAELAEPNSQLFDGILSKIPGNALQKRCAQVRAGLASSCDFHFDPEKMAGPSIPKPGVSLSPNGENLAGYLDGLLSGADRSRFLTLEKDLHLAIPSLQGIALPAVLDATGAKSIRFVLSSNGSEPFTIPASLASGGALLLTAFLALAHSPTPSLLFFEEPENGLHPSRLKLVFDVLRRMATGELGGQPRQVVLTTHNPLLLNFAEPQEVQVFRRDHEGTQVTPMTSALDIDSLMREFALGELWYLLGEDKLFVESPT
jgi:predicted ATPase